jgi:phosphoglycolate phosphatase
VSSATERRAIQLVAFDLDGTLVDSLDDLAESTNALLVEYGLPTLPTDRIGVMVGEGAATLITRAFTASDRPLPPDALSRFLAIYNSRLLARTRPYPGIPELLEALAPRYPLAVLTNKPIDPTRQILAGLNLDRFFDGRIVGGDGPFPRKPDPQGLRHLASVVGVSPEATLLVGDTAIDWQTARAAGASLCLAAYGFGFHTIAREALKEAVLVATDPHRILEFL